MLIEDMMKSWSSDVNALTKTGNLNNAISVAKENLATIASFLDDMATIVNALDENTTLSAATISTYKASVSASRSTISGHISGLSSAQSALSSSITGYEQAKQQLSIKESGGTSDQVRAQQALLDQAKANLLAAQAQYAKTIITSPINGEIASLPIKVGQYVGVNQTVVKVINKNNLHIKSFINTDDIPFVKAGDTVLVENIGEGIVTVVSPGIDPSNGKVEVEISIPEEKEKAVIEGEYVHVTIQSKRDPLAVSNTILLPIKAVKVSSKGAFVYIVENNIVLEKQIEVGNVLGTEVEVVSGLTQYDSVVSTTRGVNVNDKVTIE